MTIYQQQRLWLFLSALLVVGMMGVGAATRLTDSGLSMTEWRPLMGALPPFTLGEWQRVFDLYRETSQYKMMNQGMSLEEFKFIFWWEYGHRLLGRLVGLVYGLPLLFWTLRRQLPRGRAIPLFGLLLLGGLQGVIGWWMVVSGLAERTEVSPYRLVLHLGLAFVILGGLVHEYIKLHEQPDTQASPDKIMLALPLAVLITVLAGALTAGSRAGFLYNDWPLIDGAFLPATLFGLWQSGDWFSDQLSIQFTHRMLAYGLGGLFLIVWLVRRDYASGLLLLLVLLQMGLGIATLVSVVSLPLAIAHQLLAAGLFVASLAFALKSRYDKEG